MVAQEIRDCVAKMTGTPEEKREQLMESLLHTYHITEMSLVHELMFSPEAGFNFALRVNETLGAVNEVIYKEFGIEPVHISELELATIKTIEAVTGDDIDTVFEKLQG